MLCPIIDGDQFEIKETGGKRLRQLSGPVEMIQTSFTGEGSRKTKRFEINLNEKMLVYAYVNAENRLITNKSQDGQLLSIKNPPRSFDSFSLRLLRESCKVAIKVQIVQYDSSSARFELFLTLPSDSDESTPKVRILKSLILPSLQIKLNGARAKFPTQQYEETKKAFLNLSEEERKTYSQKRLYEVRQSGCIATKSPLDDNVVTLTTFGIFDTPRERPVTGPLIVDILTSLDNFFLALDSEPSIKTKQYIRQNWLTICKIIEAASKAFNITQLYEFQWEAIKTGLEIEAEGRSRSVTIVRAPTGSGKTLVFMINAAISALCGQGRSTSALVFPTRILNEDMFRRLTAFTYQMRQLLPNLNITGGFIIGTSDPFYKLLLNPEPGDTLFQYGHCPACNDETGYLAAAKTDSGKLGPKCSNCGHEIDYMYSPTEVVDYLPDIIIATPDKLFHEATVKQFEQYRYGLFGAKVKRCESCGRAHANSTFILKPTIKNCKDVFKKDSTCKGVFGDEIEQKPISYIGFDEVHSLYGQTATYLSVFLTTLEAMQRILLEDKSFNIRYETATATIANERELLEAITRRSIEKNELIAIPKSEQIADYFNITSQEIRHRVVLTMPTADRSSRSTMVKALLNTYLHLQDSSSDLKSMLRQFTQDPQSWDFLMGYVFKIQDGYDFRRSLKDQYQNIFNDNLNIEFLSGKSPKNLISQIIELARIGEIDILLANLVVSLGIDISGLNHMIMFGVPRSFTEYVQTAGRTGRGSVSGHVNIILLPVYPRDNYLYRHFHAVFSDVVGYYDALPVKSTNLYCSDKIFANVVHGIFASLALQRNEWLNKNGFYELERIKGLKSGIAKLLCNDPALANETYELVNKKYNKLKTDMLNSNSFLAQLLDEQKQYIHSLRGTTNRNVRITCMDQNLLNLLLDNEEDQENEE